jgi:hypothetical protein
MQSSAWKALLRLIPPKQRENLVMTTVNGREIAIQGIVKTEDEYLAVRGRLMGTSDVGGGFFFIPYDQITYLGFQRPVQESDVLAMYQEAPARQAETPPDTPPSPAEAETAPVAPPPEPPKPAPTPPARTPGTRVSTADLLKALRERRQGRDPNRPQTPPSR